MSNKITSKGIVAGGGAVIRAKHKCPDGCGREVPQNPVCADSCAHDNCWCYRTAMGANGLLNAINKQSNGY